MWEWYSGGDSRLPLKLGDKVAGARLMRGSLHAVRRRKNIRMNLKQRKNQIKHPVLLAAAALIVLCWFFLNDDALYRQTIVRITAATDVPMSATEGVNGVREARFRQSLDGVVTNGRNKGTTVTFENNYSRSEASTTKYRVGDKLFVGLEPAAGSQSVSVLGVKRDGWLLSSFLVFLGAMCLLYRGRGCLILLSLMTNLALIWLALNFFDMESFFEWQWAILIVLFCVVTQLLVGGFHRQTAGAIVSTLSTTLLIFLLYQLTIDRGTVIPYEMMEDVFGSAPLEAIYRFSVIAGSIGAIMDVSVTIHSAVEKLADTGDDLNVKATLASLRNIGADIMGTMINVLLFSYISGSLPFILLKLNSGYTVSSIFSYDLIFDYIRFLFGAIGIVLAIPVSEGIALLICRKGYRCRQ